MWYATSLTCTLAYRASLCTLSYAPRQAALAPILCAIHCSLLPLSVSVLSALSLSDRVQNAAAADGHHHHGEAGWFEAYVLPASLGLGWAAQGWLYWRDRSVRRLTLASVGLGLITAKTVAPYMAAATMHEQTDVHGAPFACTENLMII